MLLLFEDIVDNTDEAFVLLRSDGLVRYANPAAEKSLGIEHPFRGYSFAHLSFTTLEPRWTERNLSEANFLFGRLDWRKDRFSGYDTQFSQTVGYGHRLINSEKHSLNGELGFGARQSDLATGESESETILTGGLYYKWAFSETAEFTQDLLVEAGDKNTFTMSRTALSATLLGDLALAVSYTIRNNSDVPPLTEKTDTFTALSLEYSF